MGLEPAPPAGQLRAGDHPALPAEGRVQLQLCQRPQGGTDRF